ncbi:MAG TPA: alpha-L-arabinofuranosidase C-terminal domain-containing protein [Terriglobales bacterium]|nr:alpha-L-arabinofuranosidase C-terminal domain-containing protein [Terriglobales bacterium]
MGYSLSRRQFLASGAALSAATILPTWLTAASSSKRQRVDVIADVEIGTVRPEFHGHFAEHLGSCVYGGLWVGPKSPIPNINGYRKQAVEYLREVGVPVLRWPGGCFADDYHWRDGIGPISQRPKRVNIHWGGYVEDNSFGTHEFIGLCRLLGAEPYLAGNVGSGTPDELRNWIEYCNMPSGSTLAEERAKNGSPEPFRVRYWGVGNENWGCGGWMRPEVYADHYRRFSTYVREFGGTRPFMIASGPNGNDARWTRGFMDGLDGGMPEGFAMHYYEGGADEPTKFTVDHMKEQFARYAKVEEAIQQQRSILDGYRNGRRINLILDEWGVWDRIPEEDEKKYGALWQQSTMRSAVAAGLGLNLFNRQADKLYMCNIAQMVNVLQSLLLTDGPEGKNCVRTTTYHAFALFKAHRSNMAVKTLTEASSPDGLSVSASKRNGELVLSFVNQHADTDLDVDCALHGATGKDASAMLLHSPDLNAYNSFDVPDRIVPKPHPVVVEGARMRLELPRLSVATVKVRTS